MNVKINEKKYIEGCLMSERSPTDQYTLSLVIIHFINSEDSLPKAKQKVIEYINKNRDNKMNKLEEKSIERWIDKNKKRTTNIIDVDKISISDYELNTIEMIEDEDIELVLFSAIVHSKYNCLKYDNGFIVLDRNQMFKDSLVKLTNKKKNVILHELKERGLISLPKKVDSKMLTITFAQYESKDKVIDIDRLDNNFSYQYLLWKEKKGYKKCDKCEKWFNYNKSDALYCTKCKEEKKLEWSRESMKKERKNKNVKSI